MAVITPLASEKGTSFSLQFYHTQVCIPRHTSHHCYALHGEEVRKLAQCAEVRMQKHMCMHLYVCIHVCMCMCMHVHSCVYICVCSCIHTCMYVYVCMYVCTYVCIRMYVCMYVCMYACMYTYVWAHTYVCTLITITRNTHIKKLFFGVAGEFLQIQVLCRVVLVQRLCAQEWTGAQSSWGHASVLAMEGTHFFHRGLELL